MPEYNELQDAGIIQQIANLCEEYGVVEIEDDGLHYFHHPETDQKVLIARTVAEDDRDTLVDFIDTLIDDEEV